MSPKLSVVGDLS